MEDENSNNKLARLRVEGTDPGGKEGWRASLRHAAVLWERFLPSSGWERGAFLMAAALIAGVIITAIVVLANGALGGGSGQKRLVVQAPLSTPTLPRPAPSPTATVAATLPPPTVQVQPADRTDCDAIRGTEFNSDTERTFFFQNCVTPTRKPATPPVGGPTERPTPTQQPPPTQPLPSGLTPGDAIDLAVDWTVHSAPEAYVTDSGSCNAVWTGTHWVVTCTARLAGCQGSVCLRTISVCVFDDPRRVVPADQC